MCPGIKDGKKPNDEQRYNPCQLPPGTEQAPDQFLQQPRNGQKTELKPAGTCLSCRMAIQAKDDKAVEETGFNIRVAGQHARHASTKRSAEDGFTKEEVKALCAKKPCYLCRNMAIPTKMHGINKVDAHLPYKGILPNNEPNARCCCPRCNMGKGQYTLAEHEAHLILQLTTMQDPQWRATNGLSSKPLPLPLCFYAGMTIPATESEEEA